MRFLVVGCGSIGKRHIRNLLTLEAGSITAFDVRPDRLQEVQQELGVHVTDDFHQTLAQDSLSAVLVCTPPSDHLPYAQPAAERGVPVFVEKPLSHSLEGVEPFLSMVEKTKIPVLVGFNFRFHPGLERVHQILEEGTLGRVLTFRAEYGQYLPDWRPGQDYRQNYSAQAKQGGGIVLDSIHELDYLTWLLGWPKEISCILGKVSALETDAEDVAEILLRLETGAIGSIHLDALRREYHRSCEIVGELGVVGWSFEKTQVSLWTVSEGRWSHLESGSSGEEGVNEMYLNEMKHFLACLQGKENPRVSAFSGKRTLEIACAAKESARTGRKIVLHGEGP